MFRGSQSVQVSLTAQRASRCFAPTRRLSPGVLRSLLQKRPLHAFSVPSHLRLLFRRAIAFTIGDRVASLLGMFNNVLFRKCLV